MEFATLTQHLADELNTRLKPKRFLHVLGVAHTAAALAMRHGQDCESAVLAALLHDISKPVPPEEIEADLIRRGVNIHEDDRDHPAIWHGLHAAVRVREEFGFLDSTALDEIEEAVRLHSTADEDMGELAQILFLADALEPGRDYDEIAELRAAARTNLSDGFSRTLEQKCRQLGQNGKPPSPRAIRALKHYAQRRTQD